MDLIPEGCISLTEVLDRYQHWLWRGPSPQAELMRLPRLDDLPIQISAAHRAAVANVTDDVLAELARAFASGELEALIRPRSQVENHAIPAAVWRREHFPERLFLSDQISAGHGDVLDRMVGNTPFLRLKDFERFIAGETPSSPDTHRRFRIVPRSVAAMSDAILHLVMDGVIASEDAEARATAHGLPPFARKPNQDRFDPMIEPTWGLPMTVAWIVWRNADECAADGRTIDRSPGSGFEPEETCP
jgi:hypothetical protein